MPDAALCLHSHTLTPAPLTASVGRLTHMNVDPKKFLRNIALAGGGMAVVDVLIPRPGSLELVLQAVLVFICGLIGLFRDR